MALGCVGGRVLPRGGGEGEGEQLSVVELVGEPRINENEKLSPTRV